MKKPEDDKDEHEELKTPKEQESSKVDALTTPQQTDHIDSNKLMDDYICATPPNCKCGCYIFSHPHYEHALEALEGGIANIITK